MYKYAVLGTLITLTVMNSCDSGLDGQLNENLPPTTSLTVNEINLPDGKRLVSQVNISWWGDDPDGYVVGYELLIGDVTAAIDDDWVFTTSTDSTFILPIEEGEQDADVQFTVRAVDNDGARDPKPPSLIFPISNSPPEIQFNNFETPPDTTYRIASFGFTPSDPDGDANLNRVEIALNDTTSDDSWKDIGLGINLITIRIDDTQANPTAEVFLGRSARDSDIIFDTIHLDADNEFYVRAIDNAAAVSEVITYKWFVKKQTSRILFLNDYEVDSEKVARFNLHSGLLADIGITNFDYIDISDGTAIGGRRVLLTSAFPDRTLASPTTNMMLAEWDHIYWISNNLDRNIGYALEMTIDFFDRGGKMYVNIPSKFVSDQSSLLQFLPIERVEPLPSGALRFQVNTGSDLVPSGSILNPPGVLKVNRNLTLQHPVVPFGETVPLFEAPFRVVFFSGSEEFDGSHLISATNPEESLVYFGIDLHHFNSPHNSNCVEVVEEKEDVLCSDVDRLLEIMVKDILGFQQ